MNRKLAVVKTKHYPKHKRRYTDSILNLIYFSQISKKNFQTVFLISFRTTEKQVNNSLTEMKTYLWAYCVLKKEYPAKTQLSDLVTTYLYYLPTDTRNRTRVALTKGHSFNLLASRTVDYLSAN